MTHPPPDPEGRQRQDSEEALECAFSDEGRQDYALRKAIGDILLRVRDEAQTETRLEVAARLDAALATKDEREAVERVREVVKELRGER